MRVTPQDLVQAFKGNGGAFEDFIHSLIRAIGRSCGIDPTNIHWDYRTSVADGGRDLVITVPNHRPDKQFLPARRSIWSLKSGDAGVSPTALKKEIFDHLKIKQGLREGWTFVWCTVHPANQDKRDDMIKAANDAADKLNVDRALIEFRWLEHLEAELNLYPNVIPAHLPQLASILKDVISLNQWKRELELLDGWVDFRGREDVVRRITEHLLSKKPPNVLHIAGLSGIGKTRTVFEACARTQDLHGVFYLERFDQVGRELYRYLEEDGRNVCVVLDETPLEQVEAIKSRLADFAERVRVVTIGPAMRQAAIRADYLVLPEPETDGGMLEVVRKAGAGLSEDVVRSIANQSGHDLRLALLLVHASLELSEFTGVPVVNVEGVWQRLTGLFAHEIGNPHEFRRLYEVLTPSIDVGMTEDVGDEIIALAAYFQHPVEHVRDAAARSFRCGLGIRTRRFFEAAPRALAARLFEECVWPRLQDKLDIFIHSLPERLRRRFLDRCQDCTGLVREEVMARVGSFFLNALSGERITVLASREASRTFQTWAEFDPNRGLKWLRTTVSHASAEELLALDGASDGSGGWRGRRQLVWLCQNLASFGEYFADCETILFRFALHETEKSIGNNSTAIWQSLYWLALAGTELPYSQRLPMLLHRLQNANIEELPLVLCAAIGSIEHRQIGLIAPPQVIGGRVTPPPWRPQTWDELAVLRREGAAQILDRIDGLPEDRRHVGLATVVKNLSVFIGIGLLDRLRTLLSAGSLAEPLRRQLINSLEFQLSTARERSQEPGQQLRQLNEWFVELSPPDLADRVRILTAQDFWFTAASPEKRSARYDQVADELIEAIDVFRDLADWFDGSEARSAGMLSFRVGMRDLTGRLADIVYSWLLSDRCQAVTGGYMAGTATQNGVLSVAWAKVLDDLAIQLPESAANMTLSADCSSRGFERLFKLVDRLPPPVSRFLRPLGFGQWLHVIRPDQQTRVIETLIHLAEKGDQEAVDVGVELVRMWIHVKPKELDHNALAPLAMELASRPLGTRQRGDIQAWRDILQFLATHYPRQVAEVMLNRMTEPSGGIGWADDENAEVLASTAAIDPPGVMEAIGVAILDPARRAIFGLSVLPDIFEAIGPKCISEWLGRQGCEWLRWLARHFPPPYLDSHGRPAIPAVTEWFFREHETDDEAFSWFLMGCQSKGSFGPADVDPEKARERLQPFLPHELRRVRDWALSEIEHTKRKAEIFKELDEEDERR